MAPRPIPPSAATASPNASRSGRSMTSGAVSSGTAATTPSRTTHCVRRKVAGPEAVHGIGAEAGELREVVEPEGEQETGPAADPRDDFDDRGDAEGANDQPIRLASDLCRGIHATPMYRSAINSRFRG